MSSPNGSFDFTEFSSTEEDFQTSITLDQTQFQIQITVTPVEGSNGKTEIKVSGGVPKSISPTQFLPSVYKNQDVQLTNKKFNSTKANQSRSKHHHGQTSIHLDPIVHQKVFRRRSCTKNQDENLISGENIL